MSAPELAAAVQASTSKVSCKPPSEDSVSETQCVPVRLPLVSLSARPCLARLGVRPEAGGLAERRCQSAMPGLCPIDRRMSSSCCAAAAAPRRSRLTQPAATATCPLVAVASGVRRRLGRYGRSFEIQLTDERSPANHSSTGNLVASRLVRPLRLGPGQQGRRASRVGSRCGG
jgi:hypothetical protein